MSGSGLARERGSPSLTGRVLRGMVVPMAGLAVLLGVGGSWVIEKSVETVNDRILNAASRAIAESLIVEDGQISIDLPPSAFAMLENAQRDNIYYSISHENAVISGYADLPKVSSAPKQDGEISFGKAEYRGKRIRSVAEVRQLPRINGLVTVEVAETMDARDRVSQRMLIMLALLEAMLIGFAAIIIPIAVRWGLSPMMQLRGEMDHRSASDFTPLPLAGVPGELRDLVSTFNGLLTRLEFAVRGMRRFTADASHQMRTPLSILRTHVGVLAQATPGSDEAQASIADIGDATDRLQKLLVQLLALARADSATPVSETLEQLDLAEIVRAAANDHAAQALGRGVELEFVTAAERIAVLGHRTLVFELIGNIVDNAIRYTDRNGEVRMEVCGTADAALVVVEDDGPGIPPADRERVFERFTRLHPERDRSGTGLGLSIVRALADSIGATVALRDPIAGKGLRVEVSFPKARRG